MTIRTELLGYVYPGDGSYQAAGGGIIGPFTIAASTDFYSAQRDGHPYGEISKRVPWVVHGASTGDVDRARAKRIAEIYAGFTGREFLSILPSMPGFRLIDVYESASAYYAVLTDDPAEPSRFPSVDGPRGPTTEPIPKHDPDLPDLKPAARPAPCDALPVVTLSGFDTPAVVGEIQYEGADGVIILPDKSAGQDKIGNGGVPGLRPGRRYGLLMYGHNPYVFTAAACSSLHFEGSHGAGAGPMGRPRVGAPGRTLRNARGLLSLSGRGLTAGSDTRGHPTPQRAKIEEGFMGSIE